MAHSHNQFMRELQIPCPLPAFGIYSHCSFIGISLMANDIAHLFMFLFFLALFSLGKCLFKSSAHFLKLVCLLFYC